MEQFYKLPDYGNLIVLNNFYIFEIYLLFFVAIFLYLFLNNYKIKNLIYIFVGVFLYKFLTLSIFGNTSCSCLNSYFPSLSTLNIFIGILTIAEIGLGIFLADKLLKNKQELREKNLNFFKNKFFLAIFFSYVFAIIDEIIIRALDLRIYAPELEKSLSSNTFLTIPLESYIYILVGIILIVGVYDYLEKKFSNDLSQVKTSFLKYFYISFIGMFLIEILVSPIFQNSGLPKFTYVYQDINWLLTIIWAFSFSIVLFVLDKIFEKIKIEISKFQYLTFNLFILFIVNLIIFNILFSTGIVSLTPLASSYLWGFNVLGLPFEVFSGIFITNILVYMFIKSRLIK